MLRKWWRRAEKSDEGLKSWFVGEGNMSRQYAESLGKSESVLLENENLCAAVERYSGGREVYKVQVGEVHVIFDDGRRAGVEQDAQYLTVLEKLATLTQERDQALSRTVATEERIVKGDRELGSKIQQLQKVRKFSACLGVDPKTNRTF